MRILVTGGAGFIGSHLCDRLMADGHDVICVDNLITGKLENIAHLQGQSQFTFLTHNMSTPLESPGSIDYVLHFASPASPVDYLRYPIQTLKVGSLGTLNALGITKANRAKFLLASTSEVYGDPQIHPQPESYWGHVNPIGPRAVYDEAKRFAEALTMAYHREHGLDTRIVRIFNTYGPRMRLDDGRAIPTFISQALRGEPLTVYGDGTQTRSFCYVDDLIEGLRRLMDAPVHEPVNLGNPEERTILDIAQAVLKLLPSTPSRIVFRPLPKDDPKQRRPDLTLARRHLDWHPRIPLDVGLSQTVAWFRQASGPAAGSTSSVDSPSAVDASSVDNPSAVDTSSPARMGLARSPAGIVPARSVGNPSVADTPSPARTVPARSVGNPSIADTPSPARIVPARSAAAPGCCGTPSAAGKVPPRSVSNPSVADTPSPARTAPARSVGNPSIADTPSAAGKVPPRSQEGKP